MKIQGLAGKLLLLPAVALAAFASCIDKPDFPEITISTVTLHVMQESDNEFVLYAGFEYDGDEALDHGEIKKDGVDLEIDTNKDLKFCQIDPLQYDELTDLDGAYSFNPIGVKGHDWELTYPVSFAETELLDEVEVEEFYYNNNKLYAKFINTGAEAYGFYIQACNGNGVANSYYSMVNDFYQIPLNLFLQTPASDTATTTQSVEFALNINAFEMQGITQIKITPVAINYGVGAKLVRKCEVTGILTSDDTEISWVSPSDPGQE